MTNEQTWASWLVTVHEAGQLWKNQPTYILSQASFLLFGFGTLVHAFKQGGRWPWFWLATVLHGLWSDNIWHFLLPEMDNFWHSTTPVMFLGGRLPLHIIFLYPAFLYTAAFAVSRLGLSLLHEPFAVGLLTVIIDLPYDIISVKFVHWTWHATDPNVFDRIYYAPWNSLYFHATFAASLYWVFHASRKWSAPAVDKWQSAGCKAELRSLLVASLFGMPGGVLMFAVLYHPLHDSLGIHSEVTFATIVAIFLTFVVVGLIGTPAASGGNNKRASKLDYVLSALVAVHYALFWSLAVWGAPEREVSTGLHQTPGPCREAESLTTPFGQTLMKGKYLCLDNHYEEYFDFHCVGGSQPNDYTSWYTICGTPFQNRAEYVTVLSAVSFFGLIVLYKLITRGQPDKGTAPTATVQAKKSKKHN